MNKMIEEPQTKDIIGKYVVFYNGCLAPRRDLKIVNVSPSGNYISFEWGGKICTEHITSFEAIIDKVGDNFPNLNNLLEKNALRKGEE